jgi:tetratricopeptide (TPR) repeat protein
MPKKSNPKKSKKATIPDVSKKEITTDMLVEQGNIAMAKMNIDLAEQFFKRALSMSSTDTSIMDALADAHLQRGAFDEALALLESSCSIAPQENPFKWLFLGQLQSGLEAVQSYRTAIDLVGKQCSSDGGSNEGQEIAKKQIAKAYCSIAELYLTDLCFEENAEQICEEAVASCLQMDPTSLDGSQTMANLRISQSRKKDAAGLISGVYEKVHQIRARVGQRTVLDDFTQMKESPEDLEENPEFEFCITTAKIMIECASEDAALRDSAIDLMTDLMDDDDSWFR